MADVALTNETINNGPLTAEEILNALTLAIGVWRRNASATAERRVNRNYNKGYLCGKAEAFETIALFLEGCHGLSDSEQTPELGVANA